MIMKIWVFGVLIFLGLLIIITFMWGFSSNETKDTSVQTFTKDTVVKKESLPSPSSLVEDKETELTITAHELVKGISKNNIKQNIEEYFGKYANITGIAKRVDKKSNGIDITVDGEIEGELGGVICRTTSVDGIDSFEIGDTITIYGQIKALKEVPGNEVQDQLLIQSYFQLVRPCNIK